MSDYRTNSRNETVVANNGRTSTIIFTIIGAALAIVLVLFVTGFWQADVKGGELPKVSVQGGVAPDVDLKSKKLVVGTKSTTVDVPKIETKKTQIDVPAVGVKDGDAK